MDNITISGFGPLGFLKSPSILEHPSGSQCGVYLWTVNIEENEFIYYVGETGKSFSQRMLGHLKAYISGSYVVLDAAHFAKGEKVILWRGMYMEGPKPSILDFVRHQEEYVAQVRSMLDLFNVWLLPTDCSRVVRRRIEGAIAAHLYHQPGLVGELQDKGIRYVKRKPNEDPVHVTIIAPRPIMGLPRSLDA